MIPAQWRGILAGERPVACVITTGESNAGGVASNSHLTAGELATRTSCKIFNNTTLTFQDLLIGTNNLIGHTNLSDNATHGIESALANSVDEGRWPTQMLWNGALAMLKTGQGGSGIAQWEVGDASGYWSTFQTRWRAAKQRFRDAGVRPVVFVFFSLGINDEVGGLSTSTFETKLIAHLAKLRAEIGPPLRLIAINNHTAVYDAYLTQIGNAVAAHPQHALLDTTDLLAMSDNPLDGAGGVHFDHADFRAIGQRFVDLCFRDAAVCAAISPSPAAGTHATSQSVTLTTTTPNARIYYTVDGQPSAGIFGTLYSGAITVDVDKTVKAVAVAPGLRASYLSAAYVIGSAPTYVAWTATTHANASGDYIVNDGSISGGSGARSTTTIDATAAFAVTWEIPNNAQREGAVVYLDDDNGTNYVFDGTNAWLCGAFLYQSGFNRAVDGTGGTAVSGPLLPFMARMRKSGDDVILETSQDSGSNWTTRHTFSGVLAGQTTIYLKVLFAVGATAARMRVIIET